MSSFAKMLKEKTINTIETTVEANASALGGLLKGNSKESYVGNILPCILLKDLGLWYWEHGGQQHAETHKALSLDLKSRLKFILRKANAYIDKPYLFPERVIPAFCYVRAWELGCEWVEAKIKEMGK